MATAKLLFLSLRPHQWVKNCYILLPLVFAQKVFEFPSLLISLQTIAIFCILTGAIYLLNDLVDLKADRRHPVKKSRPLASGLLSPRVAKQAVAVLLLISLIGAIWVGKGLFLILAIYLTIQLLYNYRLKEIVILDVFCVSSGFLLRVIAGAVAIQVPMSHWLVICTILLSILLALGKRRHEVVVLDQEQATKHRKVLSEYSPYLLDQMIGVITASVLLSYLLYCVSSETVEKFQTDHLVYTFPFVLYGIFRYLYLIHKKQQGGEPEKIFLSDLPMLLSVILWGLSCMLVIYRIV